MTPTTKQPITLSATIKAAGDKVKRLHVLAYTGGVCNGVNGYGAVAIDLSGLRCPRTVTVLDGHQNNLGAVVGSGAIKKTEKQLELTVTLADNDKASEVLSLLESGVDLQASVGVKPEETSFVRFGESVELNGRTIAAGRNGLVVVSKGELYEVSILPFGADDQTQVRIAAGAAGENKMSEASNPSKTIDRDTAVKIADMTSEHPRIRAQAMAEDWDIQRTELEVLRAERDKRRLDEELARLRGSRPSNIVSHRPGAAADEREANVLAAAVLIHSGRDSVAEKRIGQRAASIAADNRPRSLLDIFEMALRLEHLDVPNDRGALIRAGFSTVSLPNALGLAAEKIALESYLTSAPTWRSFCRIVPVRNFKPAQQIRLIGNSGFQPVPPGGELKHNNLSDQVFTVRIDTTGEMLGLTRQDIINDDLSLFEGLAAMMGRDGARAVSDLIYQRILDNLEYDGSTQFFTTARESLIDGADTALSLTSLEYGFSALRRRTDPSGKSIDITPRVLVVPPELEFSARALLKSGQFARDLSTDRQPTGSPLPPDIDLQVEPRLSNASFHSNASDAAHYIFGGPSDGAVSVGFLDGRDSPVVERVDGPMDVLGVFYRGYIDVGCSLSDYRAAVCLAGS